MALSEYKLTFRKLVCLNFVFSKYECTPLFVCMLKKCVLIVLAAVNLHASPFFIILKRLNTNINIVIHNNAHPNVKSSLQPRIDHTC